MSVPLRDFAVRCLADLPGIPLPLLYRVVREIGRELCRRGRLWMVTQEIELDGSTSYTLDEIPTCGMLHDIASVTLDGCPVVSLSASALDRPGDLRYTRSGSTITLNQAEESGTLAVQMVLIPATDADSLPEELWDEWQEAVDSGVKTRCLAMPKRPWTDFGSAEFYKRLYEAELGRAVVYGRAGSMTDRKRVVAAV
jgi:hypothetical protein